MYGAFNSGNYALIDIMLLSCNSRFDDSDGNVMFGMNTEDCIQDQEEVSKYLSEKFHVVFYYN